MRTYYYFLALLGFSISVISQEISTFIHVDQFGYRPNATKVAVLSDPQIGYNAGDSYTPPTILEIRRVSDNISVLEATPEIWNSGATHDQSGDRGWWLDFSELTTAGNYYVYDIANDERSAEFYIGPGVYNEVMKAAGRMFFYNRCNAPKEEPYAQGWPDGNNFSQDVQARYIYDQNNTALEKDLSGGWFDAGDYNKYVTFTNTTLHDLLSAFEENPQAFSDEWNIPESGNGIPDIIDEIKWELDWLFKMSYPDGSAHIKMGNRNFSENIASPPSANTDTRYYGPLCTAASVTIAGTFAHASKVFAEIDGLESYAQDLQERAIASFNYVIPFINSNSLETDCDDGSIVAGDADRQAADQIEELIIAASYLFDSTGDSNYSDYVVAHTPQSEPIQNTFWGAYKTGLHDALLLYAANPNGNVTTKNLIINSLTEAAQNNYNGYFGTTDADLYRAFIPSFSYHWGSNNPKAGYATVNKQCIDANVFPANNDAFNKYIDEDIHYFHGVNPQGLVYLSNMYDFGAERSVNEIYHSWFYDGTDYDNALTSPIGPAPGFVTGGPNDSFSVPSLSPPFGQPAQKSYLDFNDGNPNKSWEISEPAIYYQAAYIRMLANRVDASEEVLSVDYLTTAVNDLSFIIFPNPADTSITLENVEDDTSVKIYTVAGQLIKSFRYDVGQSVHVGDMPSGIFFITANKNSKSMVKKLIIR